MLAAGIPELFATGQSGLVVGGYAVMRFAMVAMWLRAAAEPPGGPAHRADVCRRHHDRAGAVDRPAAAATGRTALLVSFFALVVLELLVPIVAERHGITPFHPHHIAERYALLTIIVLGEVILASVQAVQGALGQGAEAGAARHRRRWAAHRLLDVVALLQARARRPLRGQHPAAPSSPATGTTSSSPRWRPPARRSRRPSTSCRARRTRRRASSGSALAGAVAVYVWCLTAMHAMAGAPGAETRVGVGVGRGRPGRRDRRPAHRRHGAAHRCCVLAAARGPPRLDRRARSPTSTTGERVSRRAGAVRCRRRR